MSRLLALLKKDLLLLARDPAGLAVIFAMPVALLLTFTLIQDGAFRKVTRFEAKVALVDEDGGALAARIRAGLAGVEGVSLQGGAPTRSQATALLASGAAQACIVLPKGLSNAAAEAARLWANPPKASQTAKAQPQPPAIELYVDPSLPTLYRGMLELHMRRLASQAEGGLALGAWGAMVPAEVKRRLAPKAGGRIPKDMERELASIPAPQLAPGAFLSVARPAPAAALTRRGGADARDSADLLPDMVQQNVPGYTLFAMLFIVIPVANALLRERREGTLTRLRSMGTHPLQVLGAKLAAFMLVTSLQCCLMLAAGVWLLPALGANAFRMTAHLAPLAGVTLASGFMAVGLALAVASTARSADQAGVAGSLMAVVLAALGGVFAPVQVMPPLMRHICGFTPVQWGMSAYQDVFLDRAGLSAVAGRLALMVLLGCLCLAWAWRRLFPSR